MKQSIKANNVKISQERNKKETYRHREDIEDAPEGVSFDDPSALQTKKHFQQHLDSKYWMLQGVKARESQARHLFRATSNNKQLDTF